MFKTARAKWIAGLAAGALVTTGGAYALMPDKDSRGTILRVIDGDTVDMSIAGQRTRVRLLNVDTPETVHPDGQVECLGPEASRYLERLLTVGETVKLEYDVQRTDRYGRTLAGVYKDGSLVNADIAAAGLGIAVKYDPNVKFYEEVLAAQRSATREAVGLFGTQDGCTLPSQFEPALTDLEQIPEQVGDNIQQAGSLAGEAAGAIAAGVALKSAMNAITPHTHPVTHALLAGRHAASMTALDNALGTARERERAHREQHAKLVEAEKQRREAERKEKEEAERRKQAELEAARKEEQRQAALAEQQRIQRQQAQQKQQAQQQARKAPRSTTPKSSTQRRATPKPAPKKSSSTYTGPRCYAPGGKSWRPC